MANEWTALPLGELCLRITDGAHSSPPSVPLGKPMASVKDLTRFGVNLEEARQISESDFASLVKQGCQPEVGDVLIAKDGNSALDTTCLVKEPLDAVLLSSVAILRPNPEKLVPEFLKQHLSCPRTIEYLKSEFISGAAIPRVILKDFRRAIVNVPPIEEQHAIAHILGTLDDKIELNRKQNETLEAMARALFKAWFVDFEPVRAKMENRWQRGQSLPGLPAHLYDLFPDRLVESELGEIPEGWEIRPVGDFAEFKGGKQLEKEKISAVGQIPVFGGAGIMGYTDEHNADGFVITVGRVGAYCGQFFSHRGKAWINNNASLIRQNDDSLAEWLFLSLRHADIDVIKKGAAQPFVSNGDIAKLPVVWPGEQIVRLFAETVVPLLSEQESGAAESISLAQLRDTLLPKLISGELRVPDAERIVAAAA